MVAIDDMIREIELQSDVYLHCISETTTLGPEKKKIPQIQSRIMGFYRHIQMLLYPLPIGVVSPVSKRPWKSWTGTVYGEP